MVSAVGSDYAGGGSGPGLQGGKQFSLFVFVFVSIINLSIILIR